MGGESCRVAADYRAAHPDPFMVGAGDRPRVGERGEDNDAWALCTAPSGKGGWVPVAYLDLDGDAGTALRDYSAAVGAGEPLAILGEEAGWVPLENAERA